MAEEEDNEVWFVLYVESEGSYSTVSSKDVDCVIDGVGAGDEVPFYWNKKRLVGVVKCMSYNYDECSQTAVDLSQMDKKQKRKKDDSFHEDRPRKSAVRCKDKICVGSKRQTVKDASSTSGTSARRNRKAPYSNEKTLRESSTKEADKELIQMIKKKKGPPQNKSKLLANKIFGDSDSDDTDAKDKDEDKPEDTSKDHTNNLSSDGKKLSDSSFSALSGDENSEDDESEVRKISAQLAAKFDQKMLQALAAQLQQKQVSKSREKSSKKEANQSSPSGSLVQIASCSTLTSSDLSEEVVGSIQDSGSNGQPKPSKPKIGISNLYDGDMFRVTNSSEGKVLDEKNNIFCDDTMYGKAENSKSATMAGRKLMEGVFTHDALMACSLTGMPPRGKGKAAYKNDSSLIKPFLCQKALKAIVDEALRLQSVRHWKPKKDEVHIRHSMSVRLNEIKNRSSKKEKDNSDSES